MEAPYGIMLQDNLKSQCQEEFVTFVEKEASLLVHMGGKGESTHMRQTIDRGIGKLIESLTEEEQGLWMQASRAHV